jgi:hypothetical protein
VGKEIEMNRLEKFGIEDFGKKVYGVDLIKDPSKYVLGVEVSSIEGNEVSGSVKEVAEEILNALHEDVILSLNSVSMPDNAKAVRAAIKRNSWILRLQPGDAQVSYTRKTSKNSVSFGLDANAMLDFFLSLEIEDVATESEPVATLEF